MFFWRSTLVCALYVAMVVASPVPEPGKGDEKPKKPRYAPKLQLFDDGKCTGPGALSYRPKDLEPKEATGCMAIDAGSIKSADNEWNRRFKCEWYLDDLCKHKGGKVFMTGECNPLPDVAAYLCSEWFAV